MGKKVYKVTTLARRATPEERAAAFPFMKITRNEELLNEKNIQACFQYNASTGEYVYAKVNGSLLVNVDGPRARQQVGSDKICVDMGYSMDGDPRKDWKFSLDGSVLAIKTVALRGDLVKLNIAANECAIVTNDPNFRTLVWLNSVSNGKTLTYDFTTLNSSISCWITDEVSKKLNAYNPEGLDNRITNAENRIANTETRLDTAEGNITALQSSLTEEITKREEADINLNDRIKPLEEKTEGFTRNTTEAKTMFTDSIVGTNDLLITGEARFAGPLSVANGQTDVQDFKVNGVVDGELKDSQGFKWEKVRRGTILDTPPYSNLTIVQYSNGKCIIKGLFINTNSELLDSLSVSKTPWLTILPFTVDSLQNISFTNIDGYYKFVASAIQNNNSNILNFEMVYRNITGGQENTNGYKAYITIECIKIGEIPGIIWK